MLMMRGMIGCADDARHARLTRRRLSSRPLLALLSEEVTEQGWSDWHQVLLLTWSKAAAVRMDAVSHLWEAVLKRSLLILKTLSSSNKGGHRREAERSADTWSGVLPLVIAGSSCSTLGRACLGEDLRVNKIISASVRHLRAHALARGGREPFPQLAVAAQMALVRSFPHD